jgi:integrase
MRGTIIKRKAGYSIVLSLGKDTKTGKYRQQWIAVGGNKRDAETKLAEILRQKDTGSYVKPGKTTFGELLERWLRDYAYQNLSPRTAEGYESIVDAHLIPALGKVPVTTLKRDHIQSYLSEKLRSNRLHGQGLLSPVTVKRHLAAIHCALKKGIEWGLVSLNVSDSITLPHSQRPDMNIMNEDEIHSFLEAAKATDYYVIFYVLLFTGMRRSEILALRWSDVDLLLCRLSISRSIHQLKDGSMIFRPPKTVKGRRTIALPPSAALVLKAHKENQEVQRMLLGAVLKEDDLVFCQVDGKPIIPDHVTQAWRRLAKKQGLKGIHTHSARHTFASLMIKKGIHPKIVQEMLGHASIQITLDTYSHVAPGLQEAAAKAFDDLLVSKPQLGATISR